VIIPRRLDAATRAPASVVAGNVETSTCITNALYGALGVMAGGQCTMNNFTFGNERHQYYETISGGSRRRDDGAASTAPASCRRT
jgi:5-oxoprolinase (ATP-hydrolysing)